MEHLVTLNSVSSMQRGFGLSYVKALDLQQWIKKQIETQLSEAFEAGKQRGIYEVIVLNYTFNIVGEPPDFATFIYEKGKSNGQENKTPNAT